jgi:UDP-N-acetylglucosamine 2-epimerase (non-hydrolysing)
MDARRLSSFDQGEVTSVYAVGASIMPSECGRTEDAAAGRIAYTQVGGMQMNMMEKLTIANGRLKIVNVVGARPNFIKIAALMAEYKKHPEIDSVLVHTGQHYDVKMSQSFFEELEIPDPDINLDVGGGSHAVQTADVMKRFEPVVLKYEPDVVLVVGDVNSTLASALVASKLGLKIAHVEAGLRSFDRTMPEEINRLLTDHIADYLFVSEPAGLENLRNEGIREENVFYVGNVMIDTLLRFRDLADKSDIRRRLGLDGADYAVLTLHRPSSVDDHCAFERILTALEVIQRNVPIIFPVHPRTRQRIDSLNLGPRFAAAPGIRLVDPMGYLDFMHLMAGARVVLSDSGGIQEETCVLGVPCLTLRENTERPITVEVGSSTLVGTCPERIISAFEQVLGNSPPSRRVPDLWDGHTAERIVKTLLELLNSNLRSLRELKELC